MIKCQVSTGTAERRGVGTGNNPAMWLILLEAVGAGAVLVLIVWWTMFAGRKGGERPPDE